ncbi:MAG TPA: hypothetical protein ENJ87_02965 [Gammaproteobacteria bacterium]|nr:hypothetical protein [Gammaproteobacteria bacterium]
MKKVFRTSLLFLLLSILVFTGLFFWQVSLNNRDEKSPSHAVLQTHFHRSVSWIGSSYAEIESIPNPILWWMIKQAAEVSHDTALEKIYSRYKKAHLDTQPPNISTPMFDKFYHPRMPDISAFSKLQPYQTFFFYALSCDEDLSTEPLIQQQMQPGACPVHYLHPRCITHQLMGLRFMQRYQCGYDDTVNNTILALQEQVLSELSWDFRVGDAYIQRILMLVDTGAYDRVKPVWINRFLQAQNEDGSWDDLDPVLALGKNKVLAHTSMLPKIAEPKADFHATAQAIWLLSLLLDETKPVEP